MNTKASKKNNWKTKGKHIRFPKDVIEWLETYATANGFNSDAELVRQIVRDFKQSVESHRTAA